MEGNARPRIVVGVDGSEHAKRALTWAIGEAELRDATVQPVTAWSVPLVVHGGARTSGPPASMSLDDLLRQAAEGVASAAADEVREAGADAADPVVRRGQAADVLIEAAEGADLLVVGSRGHGGFAGLRVGSVSLQCAQHAHCPTTIVR